MRQIEFHQVKHNYHFDDLTDLYKRVFSEPPYNENFSTKEAQEALDVCIKKGVLIIAYFHTVETHEDEIVGFLGATHGLVDVNDKIKEQLKSCGINVRNDIYVSEIAFDAKHRHCGYGRKIMERLHDMFPSSNFFLRTGAHDNDRVINFYKKLGYMTCMTKDFVENTRVDGTVDVDERLHMYKIAENDGHQSGAEYTYGYDSDGSGY